MKPNTSTLRMGPSTRRWKKNQKRFATIARLREAGKWTWADIGKRFKITRQAAFKFYKEQKNLL